MNKNFELFRLPYADWIDFFNMVDISRVRHLLKLNIFNQSKLISVCFPKIQNGRGEAEIPRYTH